MALFAVAMAGIAYVRLATANSADAMKLPAQAVVCHLLHLSYALFSYTAQYIDPRVQNVLGPDATFRTDAFAFFNPTNTSPPFFQVFHPDFVTKVLGVDARVARVAYDPGFAFAHEAPIYLPATDELVFGSNDGGALGFSDWHTNNQVAKISMVDAESAMRAVGSGVAVNVSATKVRVFFGFDQPPTYSQARDIARPPR